MTSGQFLGTEAQMELYGKLNAVPPEKVKRAIRVALSLPGSDEERIRAIKEEIDSSGIQKPEPAQVLPHVTENQVRLVVWMAVKGRI
jgi:hypothetical protein